MFYRMKTYHGSENLDVFHRFFLEHLLPVQRRHGARLVGRWVTDDGRVVAIWRYDSRDDYERIEAAVKADPATEAAQQFRASLPPFGDQSEQVFMTSTLQHETGGSAGGPLTAPFSEEFLDQVGSLADAIFKPLDVAELRWRLLEMPDATVFTEMIDGRLVAFKFGYAIGRTRYLSWLGGVAEGYRRLGMARNLLRQQHEWALGHGYEFIETGTTNFNVEMLTLNLSEGFDVIGTYARTEIPRVLMQKRLSG